MSYGDENFSTRLEFELPGSINWSDPIPKPMVKDWDAPPLPEEPDVLEIAQAIPEQLGQLPETALAGSERFYELLKEIGELHAKKQADYGTSEDPFANVRGAEEWGTPPWVGAMIRATDKVRRLQKYARTYQLSNEGARDSFLDLAVYALIALVLFEEDHEPKTKAT